MERKSLREEIEELKDSVEETKHGKKKKKPDFKMPFMARVGKKKVKDGFASICYVNENKGIKFLKAPIREGVVTIEGKPHLATTDYVMNYKNKPFMIIPAWNTKPFSPMADLTKAAEDKTTTVGYRLLLNMMKSEQIKQKPAMSMGIIIILLLAIGGAVYYFTQGGGG